MQMPRQSLLVSTGRGWSACWNELQPTWITAAWCRMTPHADKESNNHGPQTRGQTGVVEHGVMRASVRVVRLTVSGAYPLAESSGKKHSLALLTPSPAPLLSFWYILPPKQRCICHFYVQRFRVYST